MESIDFARLTLLIRRATALMSLPESAMRLIKAIDTGDASARDLERIIASDPGLATTLLRVSVQDGPNAIHPPTLRQIIMKLGQRTVRSIAVSLAMKELMREVEGGAKNFDPYRFARHALVVGFLARFVYARRQMLAPFESDWSADELFSAGVLHDLGPGLLARVAPDTYDRVFLFARRSKTSFGHAFSEIFGCYPCILGAEAVDSWGLPPLFGETQRALFSPWELEREYTAQCCLTYAHHLSEQFGESLVPWQVEAPAIAEALAEVGPDESEIETLRSLLINQVDSYMAPIKRAA